MPELGVEACLCSRCHPTAIRPGRGVSQCSACGEEVRHGWRAGQLEWLHRGDVDHAAVHGHRMLASDYAEAERQLDLPRTRFDNDGNEVVYTTRTYRSKKGKVAADQEVGADGKIEEAWDGTIPEPEVRARPVEPVRTEVPNGLWLVLKPALAAGLEVARLTYARGPWLHAGGQRPKIQETYLLDVRVPHLDSGTHRALGLWRNTGDKWQYEFGLLVTDRRAEFVPSNAIKAWIKSLSDTKEAHRG